MANYVKFRRGTLDAFLALGENIEQDTLYFIYEEDENSAELYLGSKKIAGGINSSTNNLSDIKDIIITEVQNKDILVYDDQSKSWVNKTVDEIFSDYLVTLQPVILSIKNENSNSHQDLIDQEFFNSEPKSGDIIIIKDIIANDKYKHTGYVYNGENWIAMDGNYNAENIYFDEDFIFTENIGTITVSDSGSATVAATGKNLKEFLSSVFAKEEDPTVTLPSAKLILQPGATEYEVGTHIYPGYKIEFDPGSYSFGPTTDVVITDCSVTDSRNVSPLENQFEDLEIKDETAYQIFADIAYSQGSIPKTNLQNNCLEKQIQAGSLQTIESKTISGYRNCFYGSLAEKKETLTSEDIRALTSHSKASNVNYSINIQPGAKQVIFAHPFLEPVFIKDINGMGANILDSFEKIEVEVSGATSGENVIPYKVFILEYANDADISANVYEVTVGEGN